MINTITKADAILSLKPNSNFILRGDAIEWFESNATQPSDTEIEAEIVRLQAAYGAAQYQRSRAAEYPPITDYLDGIVKGDQAQIDKYIADCQAVKAKYPKGS